MPLSSAHNHPVIGAVVILHAPHPVTRDNVTESPMHVFGPFGSEIEARAWHEASPVDDCEKVIIDIFEPALPDGFFRCPLCHEAEVVADMVGGVCLSCADAITFAQHQRRGSIIVAPTKGE